MLSGIDWWVMAIALIGMVAVGLSVSRNAGNSLTDFFLGGRNLPWYVAGISMVATTFAADTPLAVTELVANHGISGNWLWWNLLAGGMLTVFFFSHLWRRSGVLTEVEFIEMRYSGPAAAFLRGFKSIYLGLFMNVLIIGWVNVAMITLLEGFFDVPYTTAFWITAGTMLLVAFYSAVSGLLGVVATDVVQFFIAMTGSIALALFVVNSEEVGGLDNMIKALPEGSMEFLPRITTDAGSGDYLTIGLASFFAFFGVVWWASWYPGSEPGGGGYVAQRMMSAKNEKHAVYSTLFFQVAHYALRPWPWILVGLAAVVLYSPQIADPEVRAFEQWVESSGVTWSALEEQAYDPATMVISQDEFALKLNEYNALKSDPKHSESMTFAQDPRYGYVFAMKNFLPEGWRGLLLIAFFAAYMSTISTQLNWGASYLVNDFYKRFVAPDSSEKKLVAVSRVATFIVMIVGLAVSTQIQSISGVWKFLMECGAGLGLVLILRWYYWRINAWAELAATIAPFVAYALSHFGLGWEFPNSFFFTVGFTTVTWIITMLLTRPTNDETLNAFFKKVRPDGFWGPVRQRMQASGSEKTPDNPSRRLLHLLLCWVSGVVFVYSALFGLGYFLFGETQSGAISLITMLMCFLVLRALLPRTKILD
ncbi:MAG: Na+:solute symporter [Schleiferiaceae bacterium]